MIVLRAARYDSRSRRKLAIASVILVFAISPVAATAFNTNPSPSRLLPSRGLYAFLEYDGLDAHADAWKATAAFDVLIRTKAGAMMNDVTHQFLNRMMKDLPNAKVKGSDLVALAEFIVYHGAAVAFYEVEGKASCVMVLKAFDGKDNGEQFERLRRFVLHLSNWEKVPAPTRVRGRDLYKLGDLLDVGLDAGIGREEVASSPRRAFGSPSAHASDLVV